MALIASSTAPSARADELLTNSGFESGVGGWSTTHGQLDAVSEPVHEGIRAARLSSSAIQSHEVYRSAAVAAGQPYQLSAWVLLNDPAVERIFLRVSWFNQAGGLISLADSQWITIPGADYQSLTTGSVISPLAAVLARVGVRIQASGTFHLYFDDFSFTGAIPPPLTPPPTPSATPVPSPGTTATPPPATRTPSPTPRPSPTPPADGEPDTFDVLTNGSFETLRTDGSPYAWREIGADLQAATSPVAEGLRALAVTSRSSSTKWAYQTVRVQSGEFYDAIAYAWSGGAAETFLRVSWYPTADGSGPAIDSADSTFVAAPGERFERLATGPIQAPGDAHTAKVRLMLRPASGAETTAHFDAVSFDPTTARPQSDAPPVSGSSGSGSGGGRPGSVEVADADGTSTGALVERYPLAFANEKPAPAPGPAAVSDQGANYDWLAVVGVALSLGAITFALYLEWSNRRRSGSGETD